ncbi:MAG: hypothetical protein DRQ49_18280 [Gammaproteobacteria bacterium]|nr:MAG: hypothetical protein DRQ49_18280 [Gammaproteobacteria bacterium]
MPQISKLIQSRNEWKGKAANGQMRFVNIENLKNGVCPSLSKYKTIISIFWLQDYSLRRVPTLLPAIMIFYDINHKVTFHFDWKMA